LAATHPCSSIHVHRWTVEVVFLADMLLPSDGPSELAGLEPLRSYVQSFLDDKHLNDVLMGPATPARVARHIASWCHERLVRYLSTALSAVIVSADSNSRARYTVPRSLHPVVRSQQVSGIASRE
jgi:6-pyruvoyl-tetrahydropterin synthase